MKYFIITDDYTISVSYACKATIYFLLIILILSIYILFYNFFFNVKQYIHCKH